MNVYNYIVYNGIHKDNFPNDVEVLKWEKMYPFFEGKANAKCRVWLNRPLTDLELSEYEIDRDNK